MTKSKYEEIADALTRDILVGQYRTGERLPSERDLAVRFDANRGAVREAMKKLEQLGVAQIQPGGARVAPIEEASLDVIGHLLTLGEIPDRSLIDQILGVFSSLIQNAAVDAMARVDDVELEALRESTRPLYVTTLTEEQHSEARTQLIGNIMRASGNLVVQLIARSLFEQIVPQNSPLKDYAQIDHEAYGALARALDEKMGQRDSTGVKATLCRIGDLNQQHVMRSFEAYEAAQKQFIKEAVAS